MPLKVRLPRTIRKTTLLSPVVLVLVPIGFQVLCWEYGQVIGFQTFLIAPPPEDSPASTLFLLYVAATLIGALVGQYLPLPINEVEVVPKYACIRRVISVQFVALLISSALYARTGLDLASLGAGANIADVGATARNETIPGVTSFTFISVSLGPLIVLYLMRYGADIYISILGATSVFVLVVLALFFAGRIFIIYPFVGAVFVYYRSRVAKETELSFAQSAGTYALAILALYILFVSMEYFRSWQVVGTEVDVEYLVYATELFFGGYLAQNHDNAITFFSSPPHYTLLASAPAIVRLAEMIGFGNIRDVAQVAVDFGEGHNTVVIFAALYQDLGLPVSLLVVAALMAVAQRVFKVATESENLNAVVLYAVFVPHLLSMCRVNGFGTVSFLVGVLGWLMFRLCDARESKTET